MVAIKTMLFTALFFVILGALLFWPAGTFHYWQAWAYLASIFVMVMFINIYLLVKNPSLLERRIKTRETESRQKRLRFFSMPLYFGMFLFVALDRRFGWSHVPPALSIAADAVAFLGFFIVFLAFRENSYASAVIELDKGQTVITTGPYSLVRHPMYSGAILMILATPLALGSFWGLCFVLPFVAVNIIRLLDEERFLSENLPGYKEYLQQVRHHLIPGIW